MSREPAGDRMASPQQQQALGAGVLSQEAGCPATGLDPEGGLARSRGCGVRREDPADPLHAAGEHTHTGASISSGWSLASRRVRSIRLVMAASRTLQRHGGGEAPASCPRSYVTISHSAGSGSDTLNPGQETCRRLDKGRRQPFLDKYFSHTLP